MVRLNLQKKKKVVTLKDKKTKKQYKQAVFNVKVIGKSHYTQDNYSITVRFDDPSIQPKEIPDWKTDTIREEYPIFNKDITKKQYLALLGKVESEAVLYRANRGTGKVWYFSYSDLKNRKDRSKGIELKLN